MPEWYTYDVQIIIQTCNIAWMIHKLYIIVMVMSHDFCSGILLARLSLLLEDRIPAYRSFCPFIGPGASLHTHRGGKVGNAAPQLRERRAKRNTTLGIERIGLCRTEVDSPPGTSLRWSRSLRLLFDGGSRPGFGFRYKTKPDTPIAFMILVYTRNTIDDQNYSF